MAKTQVTIPIFIPHLGCPHRCVFCDQHAASGSMNPPPPGGVTERVRAWLSTVPASVRRIEVAFFGGSFTGIPVETQAGLLGEAHAFLREGSVHGIRVSTRPDYINDDALAFLRRFGVDTVELGVQSFSDIVLAASGRGHTAADTHTAVRLLRKAGFRFVIQLMPGLPGDTPEESVRSAETAASLGPDAVRIYPTVVLRGTRLAEMYESGAYSPLSLESAVDLCAKLLPVFLARRIPVIRMGLHPMSRGEESSILAGPYHPAFGFMVKARLRRKEMEELIRESGRSAGRITMEVPFRLKEECFGHLRENPDYMRGKYPGLRIEYVISEREDLGIRI